MADTQRPYFIICRTLLHIGCGQSIADIDLPVVRNETTGHPCIPAPALKRALRDAMPSDVRNDEVRMKALFGAEGPNGAGMLAPQEASLLLLPQACWAGGMAWMTCPSILWRLLRQAQGSPWGQNAAPPAGVPRLADHQVLVDAGSPLRQAYCGRESVLLGDEALQCAQLPGGQAAGWPAWLAATVTGSDDTIDTIEWRTHVQSRIAIVPDAVFDGLLPQAMCVRARNVIKDDVVDNLWREESVAEEAVFHGVMCAMPLSAHKAQYADTKAALDALPTEARLQVGGHAGIGQGWVQWLLRGATA